LAILLQPLLVDRRAIREQLGILHRRFWISPEIMLRAEAFRNMLRQYRLTGDRALRRAATACPDVE
jgi:hypothetical protein